jgi:1-acyl-sn-glycerol-3-phosphate acyltransferase
VGDELLRRLARLLLALFYRRIEVVGLDRLPMTALASRVPEEGLAGRRDPAD